MEMEAHIVANSPNIKQSVFKIYWVMTNQVRAESVYLGSKTLPNINYFHLKYLNIRFYLKKRDIELFQLI